MDKIKTYIVILLSLMITETMYSQQKMKLAVLDPVVVGEKLTEGLAISVREIVSSSFVNNAENYSIVERSLIDKVMQEAKFSNSDAVDEGQATQLGKLAGADKVVLTVISRFDNRCMMSIKLIDVESATIDRQISKLVDLSSLLDVTEPLTLAVLGKGNANFITTSPGQSSEQTETTETTTDTNKSSGRSKGLKGLLGLIKKSSDSTQTVSQPVKPQKITVTVPEFTGTGLNYTENLVDVEPQKEDFSLEGFDKLFYNTQFNVVVDMSSATVEGIPVLKFREMKMVSDEKGFGNDYFNNMQSEMSRFVKALNSEKGMSFTFMPEVPVTLFVKMRVIDVPGRENISDFVFIDNKSGKNLGGVRIKSKGGRFGSWTNLLGDALEEDAAPAFIKKFKSAKKKYEKMMK